jgi:hypothetical protein
MYICPGFSKDNKTFSKINLIKKKISTEEETEKIKRKNNLNEYRKIINRKITNITRNKKNNISYRESFKSKDYSLDKNIKNNLSCNIIHGNYDIKSEYKEEKKDKTHKKIFTNNKTQNLCEFLRKGKNKFLVTKILNNVNQLNFKK